jgi:hypothetical protein
MRQLIYLVFEDYVHASFTRPADFDVGLWAVIHTKLLAEVGVTKIEFEEVDDDFYLPWEEA